MIDTPGTPEQGAAPQIPQLPTLDFASYGDAQTAQMMLENVVNGLVTVVNALIVDQFERERREGHHRIILPR